jgi:hypothetical protein
VHALGRQERVGAGLHGTMVTPDADPGEPTGA